MAKRTDQELDDEIMATFEFRQWSPRFAKRILGKNVAYDPPDDADILGSVGRLLTAVDIELVEAGDTDMQSVYVTTETPTPPPPEE